MLKKSSIVATIFIGSALTATSAVVLVALLWVTLESTVKTMLPELWKPRVPLVVIRAKFQVVIIKPFHVS